MKVETVWIVEKKKISEICHPVAEPGFIELSVLLATVAAGGHIWCSK